MRTLISVALLVTAYCTTSYASNFKSILEFPLDICSSESECYIGNVSLTDGNDLYFPISYGLSAGLSDRESALKIIKYNKGANRVSWGERLISAGFGADGSYEVLAIKKFTSQVIFLKADWIYVCLAQKDEDGDYYIWHYSLEIEDGLHGLIKEDYDYISEESSVEPKSKCLTKAP